jgi:hypothetical protein
LSKTLLRIEQMPSGTKAVSECLLYEAPDPNRARLLLPKRAQIQNTSSSTALQQPVTDETLLCDIDPLARAIPVTGTIASVSESVKLVASDRSAAVRELGLAAL